MQGSTGVAAYKKTVMPMREAVSEGVVRSDVRQSFGVEAAAFGETQGGFSTSS